MSSHWTKNQPMNPFSPLDSIKHTHILCSFLFFINLWRNSLRNSSYVYVTDCMSMKMYNNNVLLYRNTWANAANQLYGIFFLLIFQFFFFIWFFGQSISTPCYLLFFLPFLLLFCRFRLRSYTRKNMYVHI